MYFDNNISLFSSQKWQLRILSKHVFSNPVIALISYAKLQMANGQFASIILGGKFDYGAAVIQNRFKLNYFLPKKDYVRFYIEWKKTS